VIGAVGLAALIHPARLLLLRSPAPWVAIATLAVTMIPHVTWLVGVNFVPLTYAGETYELSSFAQTAQLVLGYLGHNLALLAAPVALAAIALTWSWRGWSWRTWSSQERSWRWPMPSPFWSRGANAGVHTAQALNVWIIQGILAVGPPIGALIFKVYIKTDWGIPLFFLVPLALVAIPALRVPRIALFNLTAAWLVITLAALAAAPRIVAYELGQGRTAGATYRARSELARELTEVWHARFHSRLPVIAAYMDTGQPITFYSTDHPASLTPGEPWSSGLTSLEEAKRSGFIGICETGDWKLQRCEAWMKANAANGERMVITTRRFFLGRPGPATAWNVIIVPPAR
jgi:hypothetical protein